MKAGVAIDLRFLRTSSQEQRVTSGSINALIASQSIEVITPGSIGALYMCLLCVMKPRDPHAPVRPGDGNVVQICNTPIEGKFINKLHGNYDTDRQPVYMSQPQF
jgi:hypothetical protein